jgi:hypothetical protein
MVTPSDGGVDGIENDDFSETLANGENSQDCVGVVGFERATLPCAQSQKRERSIPNVAPEDERTRREQMVVLPCHDLFVQLNGRFHSHSNLVVTTFH